ncbi:MAG: efflux RND transporter permease subunit, partial [Pirellulales bacterium]
VEYLPTGNRNLVFGMLQTPPGYNMDQMMDIGREIETGLQPYWEMDPKGVAANNSEFPPIRDFFYVSYGGSAFMGVRSADDLRAGELVELIRRVGSNLPGTNVMAKQSSLFERGRDAGRTIEIEITGPELTKLIALGGQIMGRVAQLIPDAQAMPRPSLDLSSPEVHVKPKWEYAADMGLTAVDLGYTVNALVDGAYASDYFIGGDKIDLTILGRPDLATRTQDLASLPIAAPTGELVPLAAVADVELGGGPQEIHHRERERTITINVTPPTEVPLEHAMQIVDDDIVTPLTASGALEGQYQIHLGGTADKLRDTWRALRFNVVLALLITYLLMAALFESWLYPLVIMVSVPLAAVGGFAGLWLVNRFVLQPLDVLTMLGFVILIGTVVNNAILIVHQSLNHMRDEGMEPSQAILESVRVRIRPIFMTATTTVCGLLPLVTFQGAGSELYRGLGSVMLGGLVASTAFTLVLVPTLFSLAMEAKGAVLRLLGRRPALAPRGAPQAEQPVPVS